MIERLRFALRVLISGAPEPRECSVPARLPVANPLKSEEGQAARTEAAMTMIDEDCFGFLLLTVHKDAGGVNGEVRLAEFVDTPWWPAVLATLDRLMAVERG